jgi:hypothetical protein
LLLVRQKLAALIGRQPTECGLAALRGARVVYPKVLLVAPIPTVQLNITGKAFEV